MQIYDISNYSFDEIVSEPKTFQMLMYDMIYDAANECNVSMDIMWYHMQNKRNTQRKILRQKSILSESKQIPNKYLKQISSVDKENNNIKYNKNMQMIGILNSYGGHDKNLSKQLNGNILNKTNKLLPKNNRSNYFPMKYTSNQ